MPVNLTAPDADSLLPVAGVELGTARAGIRKPGRRDLLVVRLAEGTQVAGSLPATVSVPPRWWCRASIWQPRRDRCGRWW